MSSLYNLTAEFMQIAEQLEEMDLDSEIVADTLNSVSMPLEIKAENTIKYIKNLEAFAQARKEEAKRLNEQAAKDLKKAERLTNYLDSTLKLLDRKNLTAGLFQLTFKKGSEIVEIDETQLPKEFWKVETVEKPFDKPTLKKYLKEGLEIPGVKVIRNADKLVIK
jgi:chromatin segregation and condensation protein Rec8/ScpA/Scc1 (kleisin family)